MLFEGHTTEFTWMNIDLFCWLHHTPLVSPFQSKSHYVRTKLMRKNCRFTWNLDFNPVFTKLNFCILYTSIHQGECSTSREKRTSKHGICTIVSSQYWVMEKWCISGCSVWGHRLYVSSQHNLREHLTLYIHIYQHATSEDRLLNTCI